MRNKRMLWSLLSLFLCFALLAAAAYGMAEQAGGTADAPVPVGEGGKVFLFSVTGPEGTESWFSVSTDAATVGDALSGLGLIEGENGMYGLYVKSVCGVKADYDADGHYWAFCVNGEYAMNGVDSTTIEVGTVYSMKYE